MISRVPASLLAVVLLASGFILASGVGGDPAPVDCGAAFVTETSIPTDDVDFYEHDLLLLDDRLQPGKQLTDNGRSFEPEFSPDGLRITFAEGSRDDHILTSISVIDSDGTHERQLTSGYEDRYPAWSPDGGQIAFIRSGSGGELRLMLLDPTSGGVRLAMPGVEANFQWLSAAEIAVETFDGTSLTTSRLDVGTGSTSPLELGVRDHPLGDFTWSPDRTEVAYQRFDDFRDGYDPADRATIQVHTLATGEERTVPGSNTQVNNIFVWTGNGNLLFAQNIRGPDFSVAISAGGRETERVIGVHREQQLYGDPYSDNPRCAP